MAELDCPLFVLAEYRVPLFWIISPYESCFFDIDPVIVSSPQSDFYYESFYITKISLELVDALWSIRVVVVIKFAIILLDELCMSEEFFSHKLFLYGIVELSHRRTLEIERSSPLLHRAQL